MKDLAIQRDIRKSECSELMDAFFGEKSPNTVGAYRTDLEQFMNFLGLESFQQMISTLFGGGQGRANLLVLKYKKHLKELGLQSSTINRRLSSIRSLAKLARTLGLISFTVEIQNEKHQAYRDTRGVGLSGIEKMVREIQKTNSPKAKRDYAIVRLFFDLGLRVSELVNIDLKDLHFESTQLSILGKGRNQKEKLSVPEVTMSAVNIWLEARPCSNSPAVFLNLVRAKERSAKRIIRHGIYKVISGYGERVQLKMTNHKFRHDSITTAIHQAQRSDIPLHEVLRFSRHKDLSTLQIYADSIADHQGQIASLVSESIKGRRS